MRFPFQDAVFESRVFSGDMAFRDGGTARNPAAILMLMRSVRRTFVRSIV